MSTTASPTTPAELADEASAWAVGGGLITMALFPLALPLILLTAAAAIPLLLLGLVVAVVAAPIFLLRRLRRTIRVSRPESGRAGRPEAEPHAVT